MKSAKMTIGLVVVAVAIMSANVQAQSFTLRGTEEKDVTTFYNSGYLYDSSLVNIFSGGVHGLYSYGTSTVNIFGGGVSELTIGNLQKGGVDRLNMIGGSVFQLRADHISVVGDDDFSFTGSASVLSDYGVSGGTIQMFILETLGASASTVNFSGGNVWSFGAVGSTVNISGGWIGTGFYDWGGLSASNSTVNISGGTVSNLYASGTSSVNISSGGRVDLDFYVSGTSSVNMTGGWVFDLFANGSSTVDISGGWVNWLLAFDSSMVTFRGMDFVLGDGLWMEGEELFGTGTLSGQWLDGTDWTTYIAENHTTATILLIPEPTTILLFGLGGLALRRKVRK